MCAMASHGRKKDLSIGMDECVILHRRVALHFFSPHILSCLILLFLISRDDTMPYVAGLMYPYKLASPYPRNKNAY